MLIFNDTLQENIKNGAGAAPDPDPAPKPPAAPPPPHARWLCRRLRWARRRHREAWCYMDASSWVGKAVAAPSSLPSASAKSAEAAGVAPASAPSPPSALPPPSHGRFHPAAETQDAVASERRWRRRRRRCCCLDLKLLKLQLNDNKLTLEEETFKTKSFSW
jgi:hypothetical protein